MKRTWGLIVDLSSVTQTISILAPLIGGVILWAQHDRKWLYLIVAFGISSGILVVCLLLARYRKQSDTHASSDETLSPLTRGGPVSLADLHKLLPSAKEVKRAMSILTSKAKAWSADSQIEEFSLDIFFNLASATGLDYSLRVRSESKQLAANFCYLQTGEWSPKAEQREMYGLAWDASVPASIFYAEFKKWRDITLGAYGQFEHEVQDKLRVHITSSISSSGAVLEIDFRYKKNAIDDSSKYVFLSKRDSNNIPVRVLNELPQMS